MLRSAGIELTTMGERYGEQWGQVVKDPDWIELIATQAGVGSTGRSNQAQRPRTLVGDFARVPAVLCAPS